MRTSEFRGRISAKLAIEIKVMLIHFSNIEHKYMEYDTFPELNLY